MKFWCIPVRSISLLSLVSLTLWYVKLKDEALHNLVLGCCYLEELILNECEGILMPTISSSSLKSIEIYCHREKIAFTSEAVNLEIFHGSGFIAFFTLIFHLIEDFVNSGLMKQTFIIGGWKTLFLNYLFLSVCLCVSVDSWTMSNSEVSN